jgi:predicted component of type VI protein secretion system
MALELHIAGPGLDVHRQIAPGDPALILGRDSDCDVCLPDPERNISRRHLSVWNEDDRLHFQVLSSVNGVDTAAGEIPPGARAVLAPGEMLGLSAFRIVAHRVEDAPTVPIPPSDPWTEFERAAALLVPDTTSAETVPGTSESDPFGDWGFQSTFGAGSAGGSLRADALQPAVDLEPFFAGLGLDPSDQALTNGELEAIGRLTRIAVQGLLQVVQAAAVARQPLGSEDHTGIQARELNPLRMDAPLEAKLEYLFGGQAAAAGFLPADLAMAQAVMELTVREQAMSEALRETAQKIVEEFDPEALKKRLLGGGPRIFESARAWDAFARHYEEQAAARPAWTQQLLERYFAPAYARAMVRAKRNTPGPP